MVVSDPSDCDKLTELNTSLNKSTAIVESQDSSKAKSHLESTPKRKSILKVRGSFSDDHKMDLDLDLSDHEQASVGSGDNFLSNSAEFYQSLEDFVAQERLIPCEGEASFCCQDIEEDDELFLIDIPRHLNPHDLLGVTLDTERSKKKLKISDQKYTWVPDEESRDITCIFPTREDKKPFRALSVKALGKICISKAKIADKLEEEMDEEENCQEEKKVLFPQGLKARNPLSGEPAKVKKGKKVKVKKEKNSSDED
ncbi:GSCOCG00013638001-RA-CDS [Cotesia congregata]|nr:GSCOCG00013638001-RA-CDS [Cotesia congregata]